MALTCITAIWWYVKHEGGCNVRVMLVERAKVYLLLDKNPNTFHVTLKLVQLSTKDMEHFTLQG